MSSILKTTVPVNAIMSFFPDPDGSEVVTLRAQQIAAPLVRGQQLTVEEMRMGGGERDIMLVIDGSPSMEEVADALITGFNEDFVPAIKKAREDDISALRLGGLVFSSVIHPIWLGKDADGNDCYFHSLEKLPKLSRAEYNPRRGRGTALHAAIIEGSARVMRYAAEDQVKTGIAHDVDVIIVSDGANNEEPEDPEVIRKLIEGRDKTRVRFSFLYFQTTQGLSDPRAYAERLGIDPEQDVELFLSEPGETPEDRAHRFRKLMHVMSRMSASKGTSAVMAGKAVAATGVPVVPSADEDIV